MTLDRIDNTIGHIMDNVLPACMRCNNIRRDMPFKVWIEFCPLLESISNKKLLDDWYPGPTKHYNL